MNSMNIRKGDLVVVIAGDTQKGAGKQGKVLATSPKNGTVIVEGVNLQKHHQKARSAQQTGGIIEKAGPIDVSNVMLVCQNAGCERKGKGVRVKFVKDEKGKTQRVCCKCGKPVGVKTAGKKADEEKKAPAKRASKKKAAEAAE